MGAERGRVMFDYSETDEATFRAIINDVESERDALREALRNVEHQLSTDSDLDDLVTRPDKYDALLVSVRAALAIADGAK